MTQMDIFQAIAERDRAFSKIECAKSYPDWKPIAGAFIVQFAHEHRGQEFSGEDISDAFAARGLLPPGDLRWFGPVIHAAKKRGVIVAIEGRTAPRRRGNGTLGATIYRSGR